MAQRYSGKEVAEMANHYWPLMQGTRDRATEARQLLAGELGLTLPEEVVIAGASAWVGDTPHRLTGPQGVRQELIARQWEMKRPRASGGMRAASVATRIEQPIEAIMKDPVAGFPWDAANDVCLLEGLVFGTVSITTADWRAKAPQLWPSGAKGPRDVKGMDARYAVDGEGRFRGDDGYDESTVDIVKAKGEVERDRADFLARNLPFRQRAHSIRTVAPMFGGDALSPELEGLIIRTHWSQRRFKANGIYVSRSETDKYGDNLYPLGAIGEGDGGSGTGGLVTVIEAWCYDEDGVPYITYCVEDGDTYLPVFRGKRDKSGGVEAHIVDLSRICRNKRGWQGFSRLPVSWGLGLGWSTTDLDKAALPYTKPFQQGWRNFDALMTTVIAANMFLAFPALVEKVSIADLANETLGEEKKPAPDIRMLKITQVTGDVTNVGGQGPHPSVFEAMRMALGENKNEAPGGEGGSGASGFALTLQETLKENALATVSKTVMNMAKQHGSFVLEASRFLGECYEPIQVYKLADVLLESPDPSDTGKPMVLEPSLIGSNYDMHVIEKVVPGSNPAKRQQDAALVKEGFYDNIWFLEQDGYSAPEEMAARVAFQQLLQSPEGQQATMRLLTQYVSDKWVEQIMAAVAAGQANDQGLAAGFAQGTSLPPEMQGGAAPGGMLESGPQATGGLPALAVPNPAAAALAGTVGGAMQAGPLNNALQGGGQLPPGYSGGV